MTSGETLSVEFFVKKAAMRKTKRSDAVKWLLENEHAGALRPQVVFHFPPEQLETAERFARTYKGKIENNHRSSIKVTVPFSAGQVPEAENLANLYPEQAHVSYEIIKSYVESLFEAGHSHRSSPYGRRCGGTMSGAVEA